MLVHTFLAYVAAHAARKSLAAVKPEILVLLSEKLGSDTLAIYILGVSDTMFMGLYATGQMLSGAMIDWSPRFLLLAGMVGSTLMTCLAAMMYQWTWIAEQGVWTLPLIWALNGVFQAPMWPTMVAMYNRWSRGRKMGLLLGLWSTSAAGGNAVGSIITAGAIDNGVTWHDAVLLNALFLAVTTVLVWLFVSDSPVPRDALCSQAYFPELPCSESFDHSTVRRAESISLVTDSPGDHHDHLPMHSPDVEMAATYGTSEGAAPPLTGSPAAPRVAAIVPATTPIVAAAPVEEEPKLSGCQLCLRAARMPQTMMYTAAYAASKGADYAVFFWLPLFLTAVSQLPGPTANYISSLFDIGACVGVSLVGGLSDWFGHSPFMLGVQLVVGIPATFALSWLAHSEVWTIGLVVFLLGLTVSGAANVLSSVIAADVGTAAGPAGGAAVAIINSGGSYGASIAQVLIPAIQTGVEHAQGRVAGWNAVIVFFVVLSAVALACSLPAIVSDIRSWCCAPLAATPAADALKTSVPTPEEALASSATLVVVA
jgi:sugar phosphate permease